MFIPTTTDTTAELAQAIRDLARRTAEEEIAKLIQQRMMPDGRRIKELEREVAKLRLRR